MLDADGFNNAAFDEVFAQFGQRPLGHTDQLSGWSQDDFDDPFNDVGAEFPRLASAIPIEGIPRNAIDPLGIKAVSDLTDPLRRTIHQLADPPVGYTARRHQNNPGMSTIDLIEKLSFHLMELLPLVRLEPPCSDSVHLRISMKSDLVSSMTPMEILYAIIASLIQGYKTRNSSA